MIDLDAFRHRLEQERKTPKTIATYTRYLARFKDWLESTEGPGAVPTESLADEFLAYSRRTDHYSEHTYTVMRQALTAWSRIADPPGWWQRLKNPQGPPEHLQAFHDWLLVKGKNERTIKAYIRRVEQFQRWWEKTNQEPFTESKWMAWDTSRYHRYLLEEGSRGRPAKPSTVNTVISALSTYANWAVEAHGLQLHPLEDPSVFFRPGEVGTPKWLADLLVGRLTRELTKRTTIQGAQPGAALIAVRDYALCMVMLDAGLRVQEVSDLTDEDLSFREGILRVRYGKWGRSRNIPMTERLKRALRLWLEHRGETPSPYVFVTERQGKMSDRAIQHRVALWRQWVPDMPDWFSAHSLRHTFGHTLAAHGISLDRVALLMGHIRRDGTPNLNMVAIYTSPSQEELKEDIASLGK